MPLDRWDRFAPLTGIWAVLFWVLGVVVLEGVAGQPEDDTPQSILAFFEGEETGIYLGAILFFIGSAILIWWSGTLRASIAAAGGIGERLGAIAFGAGVATAVLSMAFTAPQVSGAFAANESDAPLSPDAAQALWASSDGFFVATEFTAALLLVTTAIAILRLRVLPVWWAWVSLLVALVLLIPPIGWAALIFGVPIWVLVTSLLLYLRPVAGPPPERTVAPAA
jgi:hypothetical protein